MKKNVFAIFILSSAFFITGCVSNSDEGKEPSEPGGEFPGLEEPGDGLYLTKQNLAGSWELFFMSRKVNATAALRITDNDGGMIEFYSDGTYMEENSNDEEVLPAKGRYLLEGNGTEKKGNLIFDFVSLNTGADTISTAYISQLTKDIFVRQETYKEKDAKNPALVHNVVDRLYFRKLPVTSADKTFGLQKQGLKYDFLTNDYLNGTWGLVGTYEQISTDGINWGKLNPIYDEANGTTYAFNKANQSFVETGPNGTVAAEGNYVLIDDMVNYYYLGPNDAKKKTIMWIRDQTASSFTWYRQDISFASLTTFQVKRQYMRFVKRN